MSNNPQIDDELDDLDDLLDEFAEQTLSQPPGAALADINKYNSQSAPAAISLQGGAGPAGKGERDAGGAASSSSATDDKAVRNQENKSNNNKGSATSTSDLSVPELDEQFADKLKLGMDYILEEMKDNPEAKQSFEMLLKELSTATGGSAEEIEETFASISESITKDGQSATSSTTSTTTSYNFHESITRTMNKLKESKEEMNNKAQESSNEDEFLMKMLKELERAAGADSQGGEGGSGGELDGILAEMLKELSSKEILYEPMREMADKYPEWLRTHGQTLSADEKDRYEKQYKIVHDICAKFEEPNYKETDESARQYIAQKMEEMQQSGAPPQELMGDLTSGAIPGLDLGDIEGSGPDDNCNIQ